MKLATVVNHTDSEWLSFLQKTANCSDSSVTALVYEKEYPLSFISYYIRHNKHNLVTIDLSDTQTSTATLFEQMLGTTFLGQKCTYVIKTPWQELTHEQQNFLLHVIHTYTGPHYCIVPIESTAASVFKNKNIHTVKVPDFLSIEEALLFASQSLTLNSVFQGMLKNITQQSAHISFNLVTILFDYSSVVSNNIVDDFSKQMLPLLVNTKQSLYELSSQLFSKKQSFFHLWYMTEPTYSSAFWTTFWCDQLMKAALFCAYKRHNALQEAQLIGTGLPFSFLNKDWRLYSPQGLSKGYTALYEYDCRIKDRILIKSLDSFFIMFFRHEFD